MTAAKDTSKDASKDMTITEIQARLDAMAKAMGEKGLRLPVMTAKQLQRAWMNSDFPGAAFAVAKPL